jgi:hypothetical protein
VVVVLLENITDYGYDEAGDDKKVLALVCSIASSFRGILP